MKDIPYDNLYSVAVDAPLPPLTYFKPDEKNISIARGQIVLVPLGTRQVKGVVLGRAILNDPVSFELKPITSIDEESPPFIDQRLQWMEWVSKYYGYPLGMVTALGLSPLKKKWRKSKKESPIPNPPRETPLLLTAEQEQTIKSIAVDQGFISHLIHGVTGSGKTEIYLQLLANVIASGKRGLVLVPEISLTPQLLQRFAARFPDNIAVIHSHLTPRERFEQWWNMVKGEKQILVGARSALFCPIPNLGLIILDEEHEPSFKQEDHLKYHARDASVMLARFLQCPIILGSATPSLESWHNAREGRYTLHSLKNRVAERHMPIVEVVNMKDERTKRRSLEVPSALPFWMSQKLFDSLVKCFAKGDQAALFLNRRGIAQSVFCPSCGITYECPNCSISLTLHGHSHLVCHYCDYHEQLNEICKECHSGEVGPLGLGTELVEKDIRQLFPQLKVARADRDEIQSREDLEELIFSFEKNEINLLIGTQMIAKGLDFKGLNLVGLVMADVGFNMPDFRASERSFQLIVQVSGRAGRHSELPGQVIVQTYNPAHPSIVYGINNQYIEFAEQELSTRQILCYPPFGRLALIRFQGNSAEKANSSAKLFEQRCRQLLAQHSSYRPIQILGPAPSPLAKLRGKFRFQILIKSPDASRLLAFCRQCIGDESWVQRGVTLQMDMDPINLL